LGLIKAGVNMRYEIYRTVEGVEESVSRVAYSVEEAEELCAIYSDMDCGATYTYKAINN
jgi:hypothetical protein